MDERCFICGHKMDTETGLCTNADCPRSQPLPKAEEVADDKS
jgi:hypothetical protein